MWISLVIIQKKKGAEDKKKNLKSVHLLVSFFNWLFSESAVNFFNVKVTMSDHNILVDLGPIEIGSQLNWSSNLGFILIDKNLKKSSMINLKTRNFERSEFS